MKIIHTTVQFDEWLLRLRDVKAKNNIIARIDRASFGHFGDVKSVGEGVCEMRVHLSPGYRIYHTEKGGKVVVLLVGSVKSGQTRDIKHAIKIAKTL